MIHNYDYQALSDAFTLAASPAVAASVFEPIRASLADGHQVRINLIDGQLPITFSDIDEFENWVGDTFQ